MSAQLYPVVPSRARGLGRTTHHELGTAPAVAADRMESYAARTGGGLGACLSVESASGNGTDVDAPLPLRPQ
ncbi:hypothetical protein [Streptomyces sp. NPDC023838]|uniref:hypothetical protein n=1 Tax=Streptomyces sp. NPDC023838 TaxID=3154325 RepID=UPI0034051308